MHQTPASTPRQVLLREMTRGRNQPHTPADRSEQLHHARQAKTSHLRAARSSASIRLDDRCFALLLIAILLLVAGLLLGELLRKSDFVDHTESRPGTAASALAPGLGNN